jgi:uncharacterized membrane protein
VAEVQKRSRWSRFLRKFRDILIAGLVVTVPIGLTIWIFAWLFTQIDQLLRPLVKLVFVPNSPNPMTGFLHIFDDVDVIRTSITIEEGLKMVVSAGRMSPKDVGDKMVRAKNDNTEKTQQAESN